MSQVGDDCYFFYYSTCTKGAGCPFRHVEEARANEITCTDWQHGCCRAMPCALRHMEIQNRQQTACYYETQPGGCTKPHCPFQHKATPATTSSIPPTVSQSAPIAGGHGTWAPGPGERPQVPGLAPAPRGGMWGPSTGPGMFPPPRHNLPPPPHAAPGFRPYVSTQQPSYTLDQSGDVNMLSVEPVIINLNSEESDQEKSPVKAVTARNVVPTTKPAVESNPLDYFLNAKRWVDPTPRRLVARRSPSPGPHHPSPYRGRSSASPELRPVPRSPSPAGRRRSASAERGDRLPPRRRSHSLDKSRSQSPDWNDRRRFGRRSSRSPPRRRSRSPDRFRRRSPPMRDRLGHGRGNDLRSRLRPVERKPQLEEVKVTGSKIVSTKKEKKEDEEEKVEEKTNKEGEKPKFVKEEVKSLEDIYRERALLSLMEAKKKKIMETKRKRWEGVTTDKKSESEKSDKSEPDKHATEDADGRTKDVTEGDESSESSVDSEIELADDVDVEIEAGDMTPESDADESDGAGSVDNTRADKEPRRHTEKTAKPSIKSRLGLKAIEKVSEQASKERGGNRLNRNLPNQTRSVKDRLGLKTDQSGDNRSRNHPIKSGVIKINRPALQRGEDGSLSRIRSNRDIQSVLVVPQITIKNKVDIEERKARIKQRLGLLGLNDVKKRKGLDAELFLLLQEEDVDIDESEMDLLTKREKKKLLKKLLAQQGREDEYDAITGKRKKRKHTKRKKDKAGGESDDYDNSYDDDYSNDSFGVKQSRKINVHHRLGPGGDRGKVKASDEGEADIDDDLGSDVEIELGEGGDGQDKDEESTPEKAESEGSVEEEDVADETSPSKDSNISESVVESTRPKTGVNIKSLEQIRQDKEAKLKEALEPKSLDDIRRARAVKRTIQGGETDTVTVATSNKGRRILMADDPAPFTSQPPVKVTFDGLQRRNESVVKRKLVRLNAEQNENSRPDTKEVKTFKRARQIYVPPSAKRSDGIDARPSEAVGRPSGVGEGRSVVDYGDMFPSKPTSTVVKKEPVTMVTKTDTTTARPPLRLQKGPPKVEVKDATVKTFAEIMAEKKRKRLAAQQGSPTKKPFVPITMDESDVSSDVKSRLSPCLPDQSTTTTSYPSTTPLSTTVPHPSTTSVLSQNTSIPQTTGTSKPAPSRWKKRKPNDSVPVTKVKQEDTVSLSRSDTPPSSQDTFESIENKIRAPEIDDTDKIISPNNKVPTASVMPDNKSEPVVEKKPRLSDSFLDFEEELLGEMGDDSINLDLNQDHDDLMKEIDELLA